MTHRLLSLVVLIILLDSSPWKCKKMMNWTLFNSKGKTSFFSISHMILSLNCRGQLIDARIIGNGGLLLATNTNVVLHHLVPERTAPLWDIPLKGAITCLETVFETDLERGLVYIGTLSGKVYVCLLKR